MSTSPELLFDQLKKLYDFDASTYNLPWAEILNDYQISGANRPSKAKAWHTTLLVHILGQYKKNHTECAEQPNDGVSELITRIIVQHLDQNDDALVYRGVFEILPILTMNGEVPIHTDYWSRIEPALVNYIREKLPAMNSTNKTNIFLQLQKIPQIFKNIPNSIWDEVVELYTKSNPHEREIALKLLVSAAPEKHADLETMLNGMHFLLRSEDDNSIVPIAKLLRKMSTFRRPLLLWCTWIAMSDLRIEFDSKQSQ